VAAPLEKWLKKVIPDTLKVFFVPVFLFVIMVPLTYLVIGPVSAVLCNILQIIFSAVLGLPVVGGLIAGILIGALWQVLVIFGLHWSLIPLAIINLATQHYDSILATSFAASFAQTAVVFAVFLKTKDQKLKNLAFPAIISGICGVTEPCIYGISLPKKKPFVISCIAAAVGGGIIGFAGVKGFTMGGLGIFGFFNYIDTNGIDVAHGSMYSLIWAAIGVVVAMVLAFVMTMATYSDDAPAAASTDAKKTTAGGDKIQKIASPMKGTLKELSEAEDEAFSSGALGQGVAIEPSEGKLYSPCDGEIVTFFPTGHAIGMITDGGVELLIHVGMDTVDMKGDGFSPKAKQGDKVKKGDLLLEFDIDKIKAAGHSIISPVIVTNTDDYADIVPGQTGAVNAGDEIITIL
jgi:PTS system beta-glucosides-specific IIC component